jgi:hypothetical protein
LYIWYRISPGKGLFRGYLFMVSSRRKLQLVASFCVLLLAAVAVGCHGFFVDPTLTGITVSTLQSTTLSTAGSTAQLIASGNYDDGSNKNLTGVVTWSVSPSGFITMSTTTPGLATATTVTTPGTAVTVQAADQSTNGQVVTGSITLTAGTSTQLTVTASPSGTISLTTTPAGSTISFAASLNSSDVTGSTTFTSSNSAIINITSGSTGTLGGTTGTVTITGTDSSAGATGTLTITVTN